MKRREMLSGVVAGMATIGGKCLPSFGASESAVTSHMRRWEVNSSADYTKQVSRTFIGDYEEEISFPAIVSNRVLVPDRAFICPYICKEITPIAMRELSGYQKVDHSIETVIMFYEKSHKKRMSNKEKLAAIDGIEITFEDQIRYELRKFISMTFSEMPIPEFNNEPDAIESLCPSNEVASSFTGYRWHLNPTCSMKYYSPYECLPLMSFNGPLTFGVYSEGLECIGVNVRVNASMAIRHDAASKMACVQNGWWS